jgi:hypothetical protein
MSYAIACCRAPVFIAVRVFARGAMSRGEANSNIPIAYYFTHSLVDSSISSGRTTREHFVEVNGCTPQEIRPSRRRAAVHTSVLRIQDAPMGIPFALVVMTRHRRTGVKPKHRTLKRPGISLHNSERVACGGWHVARFFTGTAAQVHFTTFFKCYNFRTPGLP